ncbi:MAG: hypothetical protein ACR2IE_12995 [Candidatus Sumerlaeaceae bacterium]
MKKQIDSAVLLPIASVIFALLAIAGVHSLAHVTEKGRVRSLASKTIADARSEHGENSIPTKVAMLGTSEKPQNSAPSVRRGRRALIPLHELRGDATTTSFYSTVNLEVGHYTPPAEPVKDPAIARSMIEEAGVAKDHMMEVGFLSSINPIAVLQLRREGIELLEQHYNASHHIPARTAVQDLLGQVVTADSKSALMRMYNDTIATPEERVNAAENLLRLHNRDPRLITAAEVREISEQLKLHYQAGLANEFRAHAVLALKLAGKENLSFFEQALTTEQDQGLRDLLQHIVSELSGNRLASPG